MFNTIGADVRAIFERDPAVRSRLEVVLCYPGFHAVLFYRVAHALWSRGYTGIHSQPCCTLILQSKSVRWE